MTPRLDCLDSVRCPAQEHKFGIFSFTTGSLEGKKVVFAFSNVGMTFCASVVRHAPCRPLSVPPNAMRYATRYAPHAPAVEGLPRPP